MPVRVRVDRSRDHMIGLESARYPRASAYLASLPAGMQSFPECTSRTDVVRIILDEFPQLLAEGVSPSLKKTLVDGVRGQDQFPDAWNVLLRLMLRDVCFTDDISFFGWHLTASARVFATPLNRVLMHVLSPSPVSYTHLTLPTNREV